MGHFAAVPTFRHLSIESDVFLFSSRLRPFLTLGEARTYVPRLPCPKPDQPPGERFTWARRNGVCAAGPQRDGPPGGEPGVRTPSAPSAWGRGFLSPDPRLRVEECGVGRRTSRCNGSARRARKSNHVAQVCVYRSCFANKTSQNISCNADNAHCKSSRTA